MRRDSAGLNGQMVRSTVPVRVGVGEMREHLRHLGPSNPASNPKNTKSSTIKIKPGVVVAGGTPSSTAAQPVNNPAESAEGIPQDDEDGDETTQLLRPQITGKDGVKALRQSYGSTVTAPEEPSEAFPSIVVDTDPADTEDVGTQTTSKAGKPHQTGSQPTLMRQSSGSAPHSPVSPTSERSDSQPIKTIVRSGSITENIVESRGGIRKVVLETTSSTDEETTPKAEGPKGGAGAADMSRRGWRWFQKK